MPTFYFVEELLAFFPVVKEVSVDERNRLVESSRHRPVAIRIQSTREQVVSGMPLPLASAVDVCAHVPSIVKCACQLRVLALGQEAPSSYPALSCGSRCLPPFPAARWSISTESAGSTPKYCSNCTRSIANH